MKLISQLSTLLNQRYFAPLVAALVYGLWAGWVNSEHGIDTGIRVGLVQAAYAFLSTLTVAEAAKWMYSRITPSFVHLTLTFLATFFVMLAIPLAVHSIANTPDIMEAILPGLLWGSLYVLVLLIHLDRIARPSVWRRLSGISNR